MEWLPTALKAAGGLGLLAFFLTPMGLAVPWLVVAGPGALAARAASLVVRALLLVVAVFAVLGITYRAGFLAERGRTIAVTARAVAAEVLARFNEVLTLALGRQLEVNADAYDADLLQARSDSDRVALAREAARIDARGWPAPRRLDDGAELQPRLEVKELSERVQGELVRVVRDVWDDARVCEAENVALRARHAEMEAEITTLRKEVRRPNALEFWDRVMREIAAVPPRDAWVPDRDVLKLLPPSLAQEAIKHGKPLTRGRLNGKMVVRVTHGKYFEVDEIVGGGKQYRRAPG